MSSTSGKIGGEYGPVRANIDLERLESYLKANVKAIKTPVDVKQFKVRRRAVASPVSAEMLTSREVWAGAFGPHIVSQRNDGGEHSQTRHTS